MAWHDRRRHRLPNCVGAWPVSYTHLPSWRLQFRRRHGGVSEICGEVCGPVARAGTSGTGAGATVRWDGFAGSDAGRRRLPPLFRQSSDQHRTFAGKADDGQSVPDGYGYRSRMWFLEHSERIGYEIVFSRQRGRAENRIFPVHQILWSRLFGAIRWRFSCCFSGCLLYTSRVTFQSHLVDDYIEEIFR